MSIKPKKSLGQNFLYDKNIINKIISQEKIKNYNIIEIGPGTGNLTHEIVKHNPKSLTLIEKDERMCEILNKKLILKKKIRIINKDILSFNLEKILKKNTIIFGNLPYNISTQILVKLIKFNQWPPSYRKLIFMFQKEVAEKILAKSNTSKYGRITIISNWRLKVLNHFNISRNCFFPKPKVDSTLIVFEPIINKYYKIKDISNLEKITQIFFSNKRKMINKSFKKLFGKSEIHKKKLKTNLTYRPSILKEEDYFKIAEYYEKNIR